MAQEYKQCFLIQTENLVLAQQLNNAIDEFNNNEISKKTKMQIKR